MFQPLPSGQLVVIGDLSARNGYEETKEYPIRIIDQVSRFCKDDYKCYREDQIANYGCRYMPRSVCQIYYLNFSPTRRVLVAI